jgi:hypothetical protein
VFSLALPVRVDGLLQKRQDFALVVIVFEHIPAPQDRKGVFATS